jgi:hypothetical protein
VQEILDILNALAANTSVDELGRLMVRATAPVFC